MRPRFGNVWAWHAATPWRSSRCACVKHFGASECLIIKNLHLILVCFFLFWAHCVLCVRVSVCVEVCAAYGNCKLFICASECAPNALQVPDTYFLACALFIRPRDVGEGAKGQSLSCGQKFDLPVLEFCIIQVSSNLVGLSSIYLLMLDIVATTTATTIT